ncbi:unnamed protein product, partial [Symbiodinium pilosum]
SCSNLAASQEAIANAETIVGRTSRLFIDNAYLEAENSARLPVLSPTDGKEFVVASV